MGRFKLRTPPLHHEALSSRRLGDKLEHSQLPSGEIEIGKVHPETSNNAPLFQPETISGRNKELAGERSKQSNDKLATEPQRFLRNR